MRKERMRLFLSIQLFIDPRLLDGLPAATKREIQDGKGNEKKFYEDGFALGIKDADGRVRRLLLCIYLYIFFSNILLCVCV
jgi:hypothetical protein